MPQVRRSGFVRKGGYSMKSSRLLIALLVLLLVVTMTPCLLAQTASTGALTGTVTDPAGAVVPKATVMLTNTSTNQTRTMSTGSDGSYRFGFLEPGTYRLRFS